MQNKPSIHETVQNTTNKSSKARKEHQQGRLPLRWKAKEVAERNSNDVGLLHDFAVFANNLVKARTHEDTKGRKPCGDASGVFTLKEGKKQIIKVRNTLAFLHEIIARIPKVQFLPHHQLHVVKMNLLSKCRRLLGN